MKNKLSNEKVIAIASSIISNELASFNNEQLKTIPGIYNRNLKKTTNLNQKELMRTHNDYLEFERDCEDSSTNLYGITYEMVKEIASCGLHCSEEIRYIVRAYKTNSKSILGIARKINTKTK